MEDMNSMNALRTLREHDLHNCSVGREDWIPRKAKLAFPNICRLGMTTCSSRREFLEVELSDSQRPLAGEDPVELERRFLLVAFVVDPTSTTQ